MSNFTIEVGSGGIRVRKEFKTRKEAEVWAQQNYKSNRNWRVVPVEALERFRGTSPAAIYRKRKAEQAQQAVTRRQVFRKAFDAVRVSDPHLATQFAKAMGGAGPENDALYKEALNVCGKVQR